MHDALAYHSGGDDSDIAIGTIFSDEINRVPNVFFRERFSCRYIRLVKRDFDRFARLISTPASLTVIDNIFFNHFHTRYFLIL